MRYAKKWHIDFIFKNYGHLIKSITIDGFIFDVDKPTDRIDLIPPIIRHCLNLPLRPIKEITIQRFYEYDIKIRLLYPAFQDLTSLTLYSCSLPDDVSIILNHCINTKKIKIENCFSDPLRLPQNIRQTIIPKPNLEVLIIRDNDNLNLSGILSSLHQKAPNIKKLKLSEEDIAYFKTIDSIGQLNSLKKLAFYFCSFTVSSLLLRININHLMLKKLKLSNGHADYNTIKELSLMRTLKKLTLDNIYGLTNDQIVELVTNLTSLKTLHLRHTPDGLNIPTIGLLMKKCKKLKFLKLTFLTFSIDAGDYFNLLKIIMQGRNKPGFTLTFNVPVFQNRISEEVLSENRAWLNIVNIFQS